MKAERSPDSNAERVERWTELAEATFALAGAAAWALPLLDLLLRVQINVLGRHLYFASLRADAPCVFPCVAETPCRPCLWNVVAPPLCCRLHLLALVTRSVGPVSLVQSLYVWRSGTTFGPD